jgi:hypothetical protein
MSLKAHEYPDIWQFSDEHPSPKNIPTWADATDRVREFVDWFLRPQFFGKIVIWENQNWFAHRNITEKGEGGFCVFNHLTKAELFRGPIESYSETGHLSMLFAPLRPELFLSKILETEHYGTPCTIEIGSGNADDPLIGEKYRDAAFLESDAFKNYTRVFTFFHDAQFLYEIIR